MISSSVNTNSWRHSLIAAAVAFAISLVSGIVSSYATLQVLHSQVLGLQTQMQNAQSLQQQEFIYLSSRIDALEHAP